QETFTLSGYVKDKNSGETMIGASVVSVSDQSFAAVTNNYGFYSLTMPKDVYKVTVSYIGYESTSFEVTLDKNTNLNVQLSAGIVMQEVTISADKEDRRKNVESTQMGTIDVPVENIKKLPAIFG